MPKYIFTNRYFHPDPSATSQILTELALDLTEGGMEVHVVASRQMIESPKAGLPRRQIYCGIHIHRVRGSSFGRKHLLGRSLDYASFYFSAAWTLWRLTKRGDVLIGKTDPPMLSVLTTAIAVMRGAIAVNWLQDIFPEIAIALGFKLFRGHFGKYIKAIRDWSLKGATTNVAIGEKMAQFLRSRNIPEGRVQVIYNWADGGTIRPMASELNPLRAEWGLSGKFVVAYSGNMGRAHDVQTIISTAELMRQHPNIAFLFIGSGVQAEILQRFAQERSLPNVQFRPLQPKEALSHSLSLADAHFVSLLPQLEGFVVPSKFYGVAAAGRPVIFLGDPFGEIGSEIRLANCGASVLPNDSTAISRLLLQWSASPKEAREMGTRARELFERKYQRHLMTASWKNLLLEARSPPQR